MKFRKDDEKKSPSQGALLRYRNKDELTAQLIRGQNTISGVEDIHLTQCLRVLCEKDMNCYRICKISVFTAK